MLQLNLLAAISCNEVRSAEKKVREVAEVASEIDFRKNRRRVKNMHRGLRLVAVIVQ